MRVEREWTEDEVSILFMGAGLGYTQSQLAALLGRTVLSIESKRKRLGLTIRRKPETITPRNPTPILGIQRAVAERFKIPAAEMTSARRAREVAWPRQVAMYLSKQLTPKSLPDIGRRFHRDHTTIIYGIGAVEKRMAEDQELAATVHSLLAQLSTKNEKCGDNPIVQPSAAGA